MVVGATGQYIKTNMGVVKNKGLLPADKSRKILSWKCFCCVLNLCIQPVSDHFYL